MGPMYRYEHLLVNESVCRKCFARITKIGHRTLSRVRDMWRNVWEKCEVRPTWVGGVGRGHWDRLRGASSPGGRGEGTGAHTPWRLAGGWLAG